MVTGILDHLLPIGSFDSASFSMKDPSGAAAGSEGTATYQAVVPDTNEEGNNSTINVTFL
ncbi:hypothetical protein BSPWISOXPB_7216 [uncultured Gammaproteobacteria bacterium]|nr:hypothetical protein BSPWISOXPB_7216 [uncultured Gammaproteobacteria bacterium]